jgi:tetratricopeptide (TPR) repeat protein
VPPKYHDIDRLEADLRIAPDSKAVRERLLFAYAEDDRTLVDPRRVAHIRWFIAHHPDDDVCRSPLVQPDPRRQPDAYAAVVAEWRQAIDKHPGSHAVVRGAARVIALERPDEARALLEHALEGAPDDPELWRDLGRVSRDPGRRLAALRQARVLGSAGGNLLVRLAQTAVEAGELDVAEAACTELEALIADARDTWGAALDWPETGRALWARAREQTGDDDAALQLTKAISDHAYRTHWTHTVRGLVAAERGDVVIAVAHLHASAEVTPDYRLRAYGPSLDLARRLSDLGRSTDVVQFLRQWEARWDDERVRGWLEQAQRGERPGGP